MLSIGSVGSVLSIGSVGSVPVRPVDRILRVLPRRSCLLVHAVAVMSHKARNGVLVAGSGREVEAVDVGAGLTHSIGRVAIPVGSRPASTQPMRMATIGMAIKMKNRLSHGTWLMMSDTPPSSRFERNHPSSPI